MGAGTPPVFASGAAGAGTSVRIIGLSVQAHPGGRAGVQC
jgi:hypothetical protein